MFKKKNKLLSLEIIFLLFTLDKIFPQFCFYHDHSDVLLVFCGVAITREITNSLLPAKKNLSLFLLFFNIFSAC